MVLNLKYGVLNLLSDKKRFVRKKGEENLGDNDIRKTKEVKGNLRRFFFFFFPKKGT